MSLIIYPFAVFILGFTTITHNFLKIYCMLAVILDYSSHHLNKQHWRYSNWKLTDSFYKHQDHLLMPCCSFQAELIRNQLHKELVFFTSVEQGVFFSFFFGQSCQVKLVRRSSVVRTCLVMQYGGWFYYQCQFCHQSHSGGVCFFKAC